MPEYDAIAKAIGEVTGGPFQVTKARHVGGGCINDTVVLEGGGKSYFIKLNQADRLEMFAAETLGLDEIRDTGSIRAPAPIVHGAANSQSFLVLEHICLGGSGSGQKLGEQLARLHQHTASEFGWRRDNTIGSTPQINQWTGNWVEFWATHRLGYQLDLAARKGQESLKAEAGPLLAGLPHFFDNYSPLPSLLHGDLWGGNFSYDPEGNPVIFDPAVYYGDREADIAMTELFGGFGQEFYQAYNTIFPLDPGYHVRKTLYNLYHILNHFNLFGGGYASQAQSMIRVLKAELG